MVDQEEQRLLNSEAILRNLIAEFKRQGIKVRKIDEDTFSYKGVHFDLQDAPTDTLNGIVYLIAPSKQTIPVREENLAETVKMVVDYVENQHEMENVSKGASAYATFKIDDHSWDSSFTFSNGLCLSSVDSGNVSSYYNSVDVSNIGVISIPVSLLEKEISDAMMEDTMFESEVYAHFVNEVGEDPNIQFESMRIDGVSVASEGVSNNGRKFTVNAGGWSRAEVNEGDIIECDWDWYVDVDVVVDFDVDGEIMSYPTTYTVAVVPQLILSSESAEAHNLMWDSDDEGYYASTKKSRKLSKSTLQNTADRIAMDCQCDSAEIHNLNGEYILMMPVLDSDCEYYYDEYDIYQEEMDGITYNCVNLSHLVKGVRKMRKSARLSKIDKISPMEIWNKNETKGLDADDIRQPIRDWYASAYPDDDLGMHLSDITFHDLHTGISQGLDVYDHIGVGDSIVRERLFDRLAELKSTSYDAIYDMWLGARKDMRKSVPSFSQMMKSVRDGSFVSKAYLSDDYPTNSSGNYVVARKINGESMYNEHFDTKEEYDRFCQKLESSGWNRGREYPEENGAYITYWKDTD